MDTLKEGRLTPTQVFGPIQTDLTGLQQIVQGGNALSYAMGNLDSQFNTKFAALRRLVLVRNQPSSDQNLRQSAVVQRRGRSTL